MPSLDKKPYHHGELREALLVAGEAALVVLTPENVSLREIARRAGVSHAAPKHHFQSLGELLGEIAARGFNRFVETMQSAADKSALQTASGRLQAMSRAYLRFAEQNPAVYGLMFGKREQCATTPNLAKASLAAWNQLENGVAAIVGPQKAVNGALLVWSAVHGMAQLRIDRKLPPQIDPQASIEVVLRMIIAGVQSEA
jgi:AcrR family transcriptional regulator